MVTRAGWGVQSHRLHREGGPKLTGPFRPLRRLEGVGVELRANYVRGILREPLEAEEASGVGQRAAKEAASLREDAALMASEGHSRGPGAALLNEVHRHTLP